MIGATSTVWLGRATPTVLVVEASQLLPICERLSADAGYQTLEAHNAQHAIDLLEKDEYVDVVFSEMDSICSDGSGSIALEQECFFSSGVEDVKSASGNSRLS